LIESRPGDAISCAAGGAADVQEFRHVTHRIF
jgi:hypothetical protein